MGIPKDIYILATALFSHSPGCPLGELGILAQLWGVGYPGFPHPLTEAGRDVRLWDF
jgi:hypothetical protein